VNAYETARATQNLDLKYTTGYITTVDGHYVEPPAIKNYAGHLPTYAKRVVQGYAVLFRKPLIHDGKVKVVTPGAFSDCLNSKERVRVLIGHDPHRCVGSTDDDQLELLADKYGIAFRFKVPPSDLGTEMLSLIETNRMDGMSIGFRGCKTETKIVEDTPVLFLSEGTLQEISLVAKGACKTAYAMLVSADSCGTLRDDCLQFPRRLLSDCAYVQAMRGLRAIRDAL
jgi:HK97 family phage prohead protease